MGWTTSLSTAVASVCLTLAAIHLGIWWKRRAATANLGFSVLAVGVALFSGTSLLMLRAETPNQYETALRWTHVPVFIMVLGVALFVGSYFRTARPWLVHTTWLVRLAALVIHFNGPGTLNYERIAAVHRVQLLGETVSAAQGVRSAWQWLDTFSLVLVLWLVLDTSLRVWRNGNPLERRNALVIGGTTGAFVALGTAYSVLIFFGGAALPHVEGFFFVGLLGAMSHRLGTDVLRSAQLTDQLAASEAALRDSERRMTMAADAARLGMWMWDMRTGRVWMTEKCREMLAVPPGDAIDYDTFLERLHPEDRQVRDTAIRRAMETGAPYRVEYRVVLPDGAERWLLATGRIEHDGTGRPIRLLGVAVDVSEQRKAELAARELSGRLINAQEVERRRIARDLHDDLNQRLALISVQLGLLEEARSKPELGINAERLAAQVRELSSEVHKLAYQLHPAKLDQLGLVTAARSWCRDLTQAGVRVEFSASDVPDDVPADVALCVFRILQEALRNVARHSGASEARVRVSADAAGVRLVVSDPGRGFDPASSVGPDGLGLVSMQERVRLLHGTLTIESAPGSGTIVTATIPVQPPSAVEPARGAAGATSAAGVAS